MHRRNASSGCLALSVHSSKRLGEVRRGDERAFEALLDELTKANARAAALREQLEASEQTVELLRLALLTAERELQAARLCVELTAA